MNMIVMTKIINCDFVHVPALRLGVQPKSWNVSIGIFAEIKAHELRLERKNPTSAVEVHRGQCAPPPACKAQHMASWLFNNKVCATV